MKKTAYIAPEMEVVKLTYKASLLDSSIYDEGNPEKGSDVISDGE